MKTMMCDRAMEDRIRREVGTALLQGTLATQADTGEVIDMDRTGVNRVINARRDSYLSRTGIALYRMARDERTDPWPALAKLKAFIANDGRADVGSKERIKELSREEQVAQSAFDPVQVQGVDLDDPDKVDEAISLLSQQAARTEELLAAFIERRRELNGKPKRNGRRA